MRLFHAIVKSEAFGGVLLCAAGLLAIILANSPLHQIYDALIHLTLSIKVGPYALEKQLVVWINDGLMAIFFLLIGLEIKREVCAGVLQQRDRLLLPIIGALGGMLVPALIYWGINSNDVLSIRGWARPTATDIAFSLGILSLLGRRVPFSLKMFLTALAILDDIGAILIIAFFYSAKLSGLSLILAACCIMLLIGFNRLGIDKLSMYIVVGVLLWFAVLQSGVHATLAGIILAFTIPLHHSNRKASASPLLRAETALFPWVTYMVLPLFAFANSGIYLWDISIAHFVQPIPLGIALGLFLGKQIGIFSACWITVKLGFGKLPEDMTWAQLYGIALLCGVGFTMSLFIGSLAFGQISIEYANMTRLGIFVGSMLSGVLGYLFLRHCCHDTR